VLARVYAASEGFLPDSPLLQRARHVFSLELGLAIGALLLLASAVLSVIAFVRWGHSNLHHLDYEAAMRLVIPAVVALMLGVQTIFSSFFLGVLGIKHQPGAEQ
jgi:uncharacterized membrane protein YfcA